VDDELMSITPDSAVMAFCFMLPPPLLRADRVIE
jgi:hypothetical protein